MSSFAQNATVVLVHGAWADGTWWHKVILPLRKEGLEVTCAPIPLTSLTEDIAALQRVLKRKSGPAVLQDTRMAALGSLVLMIRG